MSKKDDAPDSAVPPEIAPATHLKSAKKKEKAIAKVAAKAEKKARPPKPPKALKPPKRPKGYDGLHTDDGSWWARPNRPLVIAAILSVGMVLGTALVQTIESDNSDASSTERTVGDPDAGLTPSVIPTIDPSAGAVPVPVPPVAPSASGSAAPSPTATFGPGLHARQEITSAWDVGFVGSLTISNGGPRAASWTVVIVVPAEITIDTVWNATMTRSDRTYTFKANAEATLQAGATASFGYSATRKATTQLPTSCKINGRTCE